MKTALSLDAGDALVLVDVQNDFLPRGALAVPHSAHVVAAANRWIERFLARGLPMFASRDWHPPNHCSFHAQGGPWPVHCVAGTDGAQFPAALHRPAELNVIDKARSPERDAYSAFDGTGLDGQLKEAGIARLFIGGLATDYCVLQTVMQALALHYTVFVLTDAIAAVDLQPGDGAAALERMRMAGAVPIGPEAVEA